MSKINSYSSSADNLLSRAGTGIGQVLSWNGTEYVPAVPSGGGNKTVLSSDATIYVDEISGVDGPNDGLTPLTAFRTLSYTFDVIRSKYIITDALTIQLLSNLNAAVNVGASLITNGIEFTGSNCEISISGENQPLVNRQLILANDLYLLDKENSVSIAFVFLDVVSNSATKRTLYINDSSNIVVFSCRFNLVDIRATKVKDIHILGQNSATLYTIFTNCSIYLISCTLPQLTNIELVNDSFIELRVCESVIFAQLRTIRISGTRTTTLFAPYIGIYNCNNIGWLGSFNINTTTLSGKLLQISNSSSIDIGTAINNLTGGNVNFTPWVSDPDGYLIAVYNSTDIKLRQGSVIKFINAPDNKALLVDNTSVVNVGTSTDAATNLPVINLSNFIAPEAFINGSNFRSTSGLVQTSQALAIDEINLTKGIKPSKGVTTYHVNADTGSDSNNGTSSITPFATLAKAIAELEKWAWTARPSLIISGETLLTNNIDISGKFIHDQNLNITIGSTTSRASGTITISNFDTLRLRVYGVGAFNCTTQYVNTITSDSIFNLTNLSSSNVNVLGFSNINSMYLDRSSNFVFSGTLNVTRLFVLDKLKTGYLYVHSLANFTAPRTVNDLFTILECDTVSIAHTGASFEGSIYTLDYSTLTVNDLLGSNALVGTAPNTFYPDINTSYIFDLATNKPYNYDNTSSGLAAVNFQEAIDELDARLDNVSTKIQVIKGQTVSVYLNCNGGSDLNNGLTQATAKATPAGLIALLNNYNLDGGTFYIQLASNPTGNTYNELNLQNVIPNWKGDLQLIAYGGSLIRLGNNPILLNLINAKQLSVGISNLTITSTVVTNQFNIILQNIKDFNIVNVNTWGGISITSVLEGLFSTCTISSGVSSYLYVVNCSNIIIEDIFLQLSSYIGISNSTNITLSNITKQSTINTTSLYLFLISNSTNVVLNGNLDLQGDRAARWFYVENSYVIVRLDDITYTTASAAISGSATIPFFDIVQSDFKFTLINTPTFTTTGTFVRARLDAVSTTNFIVGGNYNRNFNFVSGNTGGGTVTLADGTLLNGLSYSNTTSGLVATTYQAAIDELNAKNLTVNTSVFTTAGTALLTKINLVDSATSFTITAPTTTMVNSIFSVVDVTGQAAINNITIDFTGSKLYGVANDVYVINVNKATVTFIYTGVTFGWIIV